MLARQAEIRQANAGIGASRVFRERPIHTCDLGENCPTQQTYEDEEDEEEESEISAHMLMDEGE